MKGRLCFILCGILLAVTVGYAFDIEAYAYLPAVQQARRGEDEHVFVSSELKSTLEQEIHVLSLQSATVETEMRIQESMAEAQPEVETGQTPVSAGAETSAGSISTETENGAAMPSVTVGSAADPTQEGIEAEDITPAASEVQSAMYDLPSEDILLLQKLVMAEAGAEDLEGQILVANVVLNRVKAGFGADIREVIFAPNQFSPATSGTIWMMKPTESVIHAVSRALSGEDYSQGALYFCSTSIRTDSFDENLTFIREHGCHRFYK